jgi:2-keto-4-pentenoate hydratase
MSEVADPRVGEGLARQAAIRRRLLGSGAAHLGWKVGFGAPASLELLGIRRPLVGFLTDATRVEDGGEVSIEGWTRPVAEAEVALHLVADVPPGAGEDAVRSAVGWVGPAIELADVAPPPADPSEILAGNIFHRAVVLGPTVEPGADGLATGLHAKVTIGERQVEVPSDLESLTGRLSEIVRLVADVVGAHETTLSAGDVIIPGSVVPPQPLEPGDVVRFDLEPAGSVSVGIR